MSKPICILDFFPFTFLKKTLISMQVLHEHHCRREEYRQPRAHGMMLGMTALHGSEMTAEAISPFCITWSRYITVQHCTVSLSHKTCNCNLKPLTLKFICITLVQRPVPLPSQGILTAKRVQDGLLVQENTYTHTILDGALTNALEKEMKARIPEQDHSVPQRVDGFWYYNYRRTGGQYSVHCRYTSQAPLVTETWIYPHLDSLETA